MLWQKLYAILCRQMNRNTFSSVSSKRWVNLAAISSFSGGEYFKWYIFPVTGSSLLPTTLSTRISSETCRVNFIKNHICVKQNMNLKGHFFPQKNCLHPKEWKGLVGCQDLPRLLPEISSSDTHPKANHFLEHLVASVAPLPSKKNPAKWNDSCESIRGQCSSNTMTTISSGTNIPFSMYSLARFPFSLPAATSALSKSPAAICTNPYCIYEMFDSIIPLF